MLCCKSLQGIWDQFSGSHEAYLNDLNDQILILIFTSVWIHAHLEQLAFVSFERNERRNPLFGLELL